MKDIDFRTLRLILGPPSCTSEDPQTGEEAYVWACGCEAVHVASKVYCEIRCCAEHARALDTSRASVLP